MAGSKLRLYSRGLVKKVLEVVISSKDSNKDLWSKSIESARNTIHTRDMSDDELIKIAMGSADPISFNTVIKLIYRFTRTNPNGHQGVECFFNSVDESPYSLSQWIEAIEFFSHWLDENKRTTPWPTLLGYLSCCTESPENKNIKHNLKHLLKDMLETYGYEG